MKRVIVDVLIGLTFAVVGQVVQFGVSLIGPLLGIPFPFESAPEDGSIPPELVAQINVMFAVASVVMLVLSFALAWLLKLRGAREGAMRGSIWLAVVAVVQLLPGLLGGGIPLFGFVGVYAYFLSILLGPVLAGLLRGKPQGRSFTV